MDTIKGEERASVRQIDELYIPQDERELRRVQRRAEELDRAVRGWAGTVVAVLPKGLSLLHEEINVVQLFLAQQRRLNLELDARSTDPTLRTRIGRVLPFLGEGTDDWETTRAVHQIVATQLEADIERACCMFCVNQNIPPVSDPAIDWRVSIRYLAQGVHHIACQIDMRKDYDTSPRRFELALMARDAAADIASKRRSLFDAFSKEPV
jgi:hypothetical protein